MGGSLRRYSTPVVQTPKEPIEQPVQKKEIGLAPPSAPKPSIQFPEDPNDPDFKPVNQAYSALQLGPSDVHQRFTSGSYAGELAGIGRGKKNPVAMLSNWFVGRDRRYDSLSLSLSLFLPSFITKSSFFIGNFPRSAWVRYIKLINDRWCPL